MTDRCRLLDGAKPTTVPEGVIPEVVIHVVIEPTPAQIRQMRWRYALFGYVCVETVGGPSAFDEETGRPKWVADLGLESLFER